MSSVVDAFREQFWVDFNEEKVRPLAEYLTLFPGDEMGIAAKFLKLNDGQTEDGPWPADRIGTYKIIKELGRGGQATVYLAEDTALHRHVALKVLHDRGLLQSAGLDRFQREALAASALQHPGICAVY